jgi:hypothetical protein
MTAPEKLLHVSESLFYQQAPVTDTELGTSSAHRRVAKGGFATLPAGVEPNLRVPGPDLSASWGCSASRYLAGPDVSCSPQPPTELQALRPYRNHKNIDHPAKG